MVCARVRFKLASWSAACPPAIGRCSWSRNRVQTNNRPKKAPPAFYHSWGLWESERPLAGVALHSFICISWPRSLSRSTSACVVALTAQIATRAQAHGRQPSAPIEMQPDGTQLVSNKICERSGSADADRVRLESRNVCAVECSARRSPPVLALA